ncbi:succinate dehydrogenase hydrophobic anchor subunit, partial [Ralstonia pickettii]
MANNNIGPKRLVVGAHYGLKDFLAQRVTAVIMAVYTVVLLAAFLLSKDTS